MKGGLNLVTCTGIVLLDLRNLFTAAFLVIAVLKGRCCLLGSKLVQPLRATAQLPTVQSRADRAFLLSKPCRLEPSIALSHIRQESGTVNNGFIHHQQDG